LGEGFNLLGPSLFHPPFDDPFPCCDNVHIRSRSDRIHPLFYTAFLTSVYRNEILLVPEFLIQRTFQGGKLEMTSNQFRMSVTEPGSGPGGELPRMGDPRAGQEEDLPVIIFMLVPLVVELLADPFGSLIWSIDSKFIEIL